jgi:hypothetical protein
VREPDQYDGSGKDGADRAIARRAFPAISTSVDAWARNIPDGAGAIVRADPSRLEHFLIHVQDGMDAGAGDARCGASVD